MEECRKFTFNSLTVYKWVHFTEILFNKKKKNVLPWNYNSV